MGGTEEEVEEEEEGEEGEVEISQSWFKEMLKQNVSKAKSDYFRTYWDKLDACFDDIDLSLLKYQNEKNRLLTLESGRLIKSKFATFNGTLEEIHANHKFLLLFFDQTKDDMRRLCKEKIARYEVFFQKYSAYQFSKKNQAEYLRYPPLLAEAMIDELFQGEINDN